jgi:predicted Zn-dependent protease
LLRTEGESAEKPTYVAYYALGLIRQRDFDGAERWVAALEKLQPDALRTCELRARLLAGSGNLTKARDLLLVRADQADVPLGIIARLLEEVGAPAAAENIYRRLVASSTQPGAALLLASYYGRQNRVAEALQICAQYENAGNLEAISGIYVDILYSAREPREEQISEAMARVQSALDKKPESPALLSMMAALLNLKQDYPAAIDFYRRALARGHNDILSQNNLAFLLSASAGKHEEALAELSQAKSKFGPLATLLDTEAQIHIAIGDPLKAVALLNDVVSQDSAEPLYYYHLAQAYHAAHRRLDALAAWRQARKLNLTPANLHRLERDAYRTLESNLEQTK